MIIGHLDIHVQMRCYTLMTIIPHGVINTIMINCHDYRGELGA
jgi:hypothetical protein